MMGVDQESMREPTDIGGDAPCPHLAEWTTPCVSMNTEKLCGLSLALDSSGVSFREAGSFDLGTNECRACGWRRLNAFSPARYPGGHTGELSRLRIGLVFIEPIRVAKTWSVIAGRCRNRLMK